jgi:hypothetical protein
MALDGMGWHGIAWDCVGWHGIAWDCMGLCGMAWDGMVRKQKEGKKRQMTAKVSQRQKDSRRWQKFKVLDMFEVMVGGNQRYCNC